MVFLLAILMMAFSCAQQESQSLSDAVNAVIMSRRSIRQYKPVTVGRDTLEMILKAGINAPNGMNKQSWEIRVVDNPDVLEQFKEAMREANSGNRMAGECFRGAPVMVFIANDTAYDC